MTIKKYKKLKSLSTSLHLQGIIKNSYFFCLLQTKHLNHKERLLLKQASSVIGLNMFICKNSLLKLKNILFNLPNGTLYNLKHGNLIILYCKNFVDFIPIYEFFNSKLLLKNIKVFPVVFYYLNRFISYKCFKNIGRISRRDSFCYLINVLRYSSYNVLDKITLPGRLLLYNLSYSRYKFLI